MAILHDLRFTDPKKIVGLKEKPFLNPETNKKEIDQSGFVIDLNK